MAWFQRRLMHTSRHQSPFIAHSLIDSPRTHFFSVAHVRASRILLVSKFSENLAYTRVYTVVASLYIYSCI